jgi:hypothetical protein
MSDAGTTAARMAELAGIRWRGQVVSRAAEIVIERKDELGDDQRERVLSALAEPARDGDAR